MVRRQLKKSEPDISKKWKVKLTKNLEKMADSDVILQIRLNLTGKGSSVPDCHIFHFKEVFGSLYPRILSNLKVSKIEINVKLFLRIGS